MGVQKGTNSAAPVVGAGTRRRWSAPVVGAGGRRRWSAPVVGAGGRRQVVHGHRVPVSKKTLQVRLRCAFRR